MDDARSQQLNAEVLHPIEVLAQAYAQVAPAHTHD